MQKDSNLGSDDVKSINCLCSEKLILGAWRGVQMRNGLNKTKKEDVERSGPALLYLGCERSGEEANCGNGPHIEAVVKRRLRGDYK